MSRHGYRGDGAFGQFCVILPEQETVIVTTAYTLDMQAMLDAMWTHLLPGLGTVSPAPGQRKISSAPGSPALSCPPAPSLRHPPTGAHGPAGRSPSPLAPRAPQVQPALTSIEVAPEPGGWQISLIEAANALTLPVGAGTWAISDHADRYGEIIPVAASGGWLDQPHAASRGHLPGNSAPDGHHLLPPQPHRRGCVAPPATQSQQAPTPALPGLNRLRPSGFCELPEEDPGEIGAGGIGNVQVNRGETGAVDHARGPAVSDEVCAGRIGPQDLARGAVAGH